MDSSASRSAQTDSASLRKPPLPPVTVVICTRHRPDSLNTCLDAVTRLKPSADELLVIDNSEGDKKTEAVARKHGARYLVEPAEGLSRARNRGMAESSSEIVVFFDDDALPREDWLKQTLPHFADPEVAVVTGHVLAPGSLAEPDLQRRIRQLSGKDPHWFTMATFGGWSMGGSNMALRRAACSRWKGFDPRLGRGAPLHIAEELHAFASLLQLGYRAVHAPSAVVVHYNKPLDTRHLDREVARQFAYWLLLLDDFPGHRVELVRFLLRRLRGKPLPWPREAEVQGQIVSAPWPVRIKGALAGIKLYLHSRKLRLR